LSFVPDFLPIEMQGMSVITAICLCFLVVGEMILFKWMYDMYTKHDTAIEDIKMDLNDMKVDVAETKVMVKSIGKSLDNISNTNRQVIDILLKKQ